MASAFLAAKARRRGYLLAVAAAVLWATGGLLAKWLLSSPDSTGAQAWLLPPMGVEVDAVVLAGARACVSAVLLFAYLAARNPKALQVRFRDLGFLATFGIIGLAAVHLTYFRTIDLTDVATAILLQYLAPVIVMLVSVAFLGEQLRWSLPLGVGLSVLGCALVVGAFASDGLLIPRAGLIWGLASAVFFAAYSLMGRIAVGRHDSWTLLAWGLVFAAVFWVIYIGGVTEIIDLLSTPQGLAAVLYMSVFATILPFGAFLRALQYIEATKAVVTSTLEPVVAGFAAFLLFAETLTASQYLGALLVIGAILVIQGRLVIPGNASRLPAS